MRDLQRRRPAVPTGSISDNVSIYGNHFLVKWLYFFAKTIHILYERTDKQHMIDIHSHILPFMDDGAADYDAALAMALDAHNDGITTVVATPTMRTESI